MRAASPCRAAEPWKDCILFAPTEIDRRRPRRGALPARLAGTVLLGLTLGACTTFGSGFDEQNFVPSTNPVTVDSASRNDRLAAVARQQHPRILATYGGEYSDPKLERMVAKVVGNLTLASDNPQQAYRITLLNSPNVNAFALPGGYLYVTRGLLALANDSSELAAVIAHEMGHVTASHGLARQQMEAEEQLAARVVSDVLSGDRQAQAALIRGKLRLAQFSRNQELEADAIGIRTIGKAGYEPYAAPRFLQSMASYSGFRAITGAQDASLDFLATHPNAPQRIDLALRHARGFGQPGTGTRDRDAFLDGIDGMLFGDTPEEGYVRGNTFLHPSLGISFTVPDGFVIDNTATAVTAAGPGDSAIRFDGVTVDRNLPLSAYLRSGWVTGLQDETVRESVVNGVPAAYARASADGWQFDIAVFRSGDKVYRLLSAAPLSSQGFEAQARRVSDSFRVLSDAEKAALQPLRVRVLKVGPSETIATLAARMSGVDRKLDLFRLLNALPPGGTVSAGDRVKIITDR